MADKALTYSSIQTFKNCRKRYQLRYELGLVPVERPVFFATGVALHIALENLYSKMKPWEILPLIENYFKENQPDIGDLERLEKWDAERRLAEAVFNRYAEQYAIEPFEVVAVEKEFCVPIVNPESGRSSFNFSIAGKADMIVRQNEKYWIVEHKTTSALNGIYKKKLTLDNQSILYLEALERELNIPIQGVIYNVIVKAVPHKPKILKNGELSRDKGQCTTLELYRQTIKENFLDEKEYEGFLAYLQYQSGREYFYREYLSFGPEDLEMWRKELWDIAKDVRQCELTSRFYRNTANCVGMGICPYFDICTAIDQDAVIEASFQKIEKLHTELEKNVDEIVTEAHAF